MTGRWFKRAAFAMLMWMPFGCGHAEVSKPSSEAAGSAGTAAGTYRVYIGTFTDRQSKGVYLLQMDAGTGALSEPQLVAEAKSPSFLAVHPTDRFIYSVNEVNDFGGGSGGGVSAFAIDTGSGKLSPLNAQPSAGSGPTHIAIDRAGNAVLVANYGSGSVAVLPVKQDGTLDKPSSVDQHQGKGADPQRQEGPHAHCVALDPTNRFALSADLGLDKVFVYRFDGAKGTITPNDPPFATMAAGSGPRHLAFHPSGKYVYVNTEMACTVAAFQWDGQRGTLSQFQEISTLPESFSGNKSTAEVAVHPSGKFLYVSNRGDANNIAAFQIDPANGRLTAAGHTSTGGKTPRSFGIDPTGRWLIAANQDTDNLFVFRIDPGTGALSPAGVEVKVPTPVCVTYVPVPRGT